MLTYPSSKEAESDRRTLGILLRALGVSKRSVRRDQCGSWFIKGRKGHAYTWSMSGGWLLYCDAGTSRKWSSVKRRLSFCKVTQDGDTDGCLQLFELPTSDQATAIRRVLGLRRKPRAEVAGFPSINLASAKKGVSGPPASEDGKGSVRIDPEATAQKYRQNPLIDEPDAVAELSLQGDTT
jgi:hypothetical protein